MSEHKCELCGKSVNGVSPSERYFQCDNTDCCHINENKDFGGEENG